MAVKSFFIQFHFQNQPKIISHTNFFFTFHHQIALIRFNFSLKKFLSYLYNVCWCLFNYFISSPTQEIIFCFSLNFAPFIFCDVIIFPSVCSPQGPETVTTSDHFRPHLTTFDFSYPHLTTSDHIWPLLTTWLLSTTFDNFRQLSTIFNNFRILSTTFEYFR